MAAVATDAGGILLDPKAAQVGGGSLTDNLEAIELRLVSSQNVPANSMVAVRVGPRSQQFALNQGQVFNFTQQKEEADPVAKFSVYSQLAHARLLMEPGEARFTLPLEAQGGGSAMAVEFEVVGNLDPAVPPSPSRPLQEDDGGLWSHLVPSDMVPYFRQHRLLSILTALLQGVIREQPDDLRGFMVRVLRNSLQASSARKTAASGSAVAGGRHALRLTGATGIPAGAVLSIRVGRTRQQAVVKVGQVYEFSGIDAIDHMKVSVLSLLGQRKAALSRDQTSSAPFTVEVKPVQGAGAGSPMTLTMGVSFSSVQTEPELPADEVQDLSSKSARQARHKKALDVEPYFQKHGVLDLLQELLQGLMKQKPDEPLVLMMQVLQPGVIMSSPPAMLDLQQKAPVSVSPGAAFSPSVCTWSNPRLGRLRPRHSSSKADIWEEVQQPAYTSYKAALPMFLPSVGSWATARMKPLAKPGAPQAATEKPSQASTAAPTGAAAIGVIESPKPSDSGQAPLKLPSVGTWVMSVPWPLEDEEAAASKPPAAVASGAAAASVAEPVRPEPARPASLEQAPLKLPSVGTWVMSLPWPLEDEAAAAAPPAAAVAAGSTTAAVTPELATEAAASKPPVAPAAAAAPAAESGAGAASVAEPEGPASLEQVAPEQAPLKLPSVGTWVMSVPWPLDDEEASDVWLSGARPMSSEDVRREDTSGAITLPVIAMKLADEDLSPTTFKIVEHKVATPSKTPSEGTLASGKSSPAGRKVFHCTETSLVARAQNILTKAEERNVSEENELQHWLAESRGRLDKEMRHRLAHGEEDGDIVEESMVLSQCDVEEEVCSRLANMADERREAAREAKNILNEVGSHSVGEVLARAQRLLQDAEIRSKVQEDELQKWLASEHEKLDAEVVARMDEQKKAAGNPKGVKSMAEDPNGLNDMPSDIERWMVQAQCELEEQACSRLASMAEERREAVRRARGLLRLWYHDDSRPEHRKASIENVPASGSS